MGTPPVPYIGDSAGRFHAVIANRLEVIRGRLASESVFPQYNSVADAAACNGRVIGSLATASRVEILLAEDDSITGKRRKETAAHLACCFRHGFSRQSSAP